MANFFRTMVHLIVWWMAGIIWAMTFTQLPITWVLLKHFSTFLVIFELCRVGLVLIMGVIALFFDRVTVSAFDTTWNDNAIAKQDKKRFKEQYAIGNKQLGEGVELRFLKSWDYKMEMLNISLQAIAYPLLHFGIEGSW